jgi:hypothetical protein
VQIVKPKEDWIQLEDKNKKKKEKKQWIKNPAQIDKKEEEMKRSATEFHMRIQSIPPLYDAGMEEDPSQNRNLQLIHQSE